MTAWGWHTDQQLGEGGFGQVYEAYGPTGGRFAAKVVRKAEGASREQLIAQDSPVSPHVVPIVHVEETADSFVLFMPRAEYSLRDKIGSGISASEAIAILIEIAKALSVIAPSVVHRDVKPDNVLYINRTWALCDFGIARYADAATAEDTRKFSLSAWYAAPEQWRYEHATSAADIYAFGVIAYELLSGERPFSGTRDELRAQHLSSTPPVLPGNRKLSWIVSECLQKAPETRPTAANLLVRLQRAGVEANTRGATALAAAQSAVLEARATEQAQREAARSEQERRSALSSSANISFSALVEELVEFIVDSAPATSVSRQGGGATLALGSAQLRISAPTPSRTSEANFDVISAGEIQLTGSGRSRSHSLYFVDFEEPRAYSWYELGFMSTFSGADFNNEPRSMQPSEGLTALNGVFGGIQLAWGIKRLEIDDLERFVDFWSERFGQAAAGRFPTIHQLPDGPTNYPPRRR